MEMSNNQDLSYQKKVWIKGGIYALIIVTLLLFKALVSLLLLVFASVLLTIYFYGFAGLFQKHFNWSPRVSIITAIILNVLLLIVFFWFVGARIQQQVAELSDTLPSTIQKAKDQISQTPIGNRLVQHFSSSGESQKAAGIIKSFFSSSFGILSDLYIIILLTSFFTATPSSYKKGLIKLLPAKARDKGTDLVNRISILLKKWIKGQIFGIFFIAVLTGIGLLILGMPLVLTLALIAGLLNFIPNIGPLIALIPAVLIALTKGTTTALIIVGMYTLIQVIQSAVTQPLIQKKMISIPPALIIIGQVGLGALTGFWGVLLATPLVAILMTIIQDLYIKKQDSQAG